VYAIVRAGGRQEKVSVGDVLIIDKVRAGAGESVDLAPLLLVKVTAEVIQPAKGPKIVIQKFKNKTGYKKRQGHRQPLTKVKITAIDS
jgi:large subunit ribosomal protein L21